MGPTQQVLKSALVVRGDACGFGGFASQDTRDASRHLTSQTEWHRLSSVTRNRAPSWRDHTLHSDP